MSVVVCFLLQGSCFTLYLNPLPARSFFFLHGAQAVVFGSVSQLQRGKRFVTEMLQFCASIVTVQISRIQRSAAPSVRSFSASFSTVLASI